MSTVTQNQDAGDVKSQRRNKSDSSLKSLMSVNNLDSYSLPPSLSVTVARSHKRSFARSEIYSHAGANTVTFVLSPGSDFVYGPDSFLQFKLKAKLDPDATSYAMSENHTYLSLFKEIRITHASGVELEQISGLNLLSFYKRWYERTASWRNRYDNMMGMATGGVNTDIKTDLAAVGGIDVSIPLSILSEMFNLEKLLPSYLLAGLRIELLLEEPAVAFKMVTSGAGTPAYTIEQPRMYLDSHTLTDSVQKAMARMSAVEGLDLSFSSYYDEVHDITGSASRSTIAISKALSRVEDIKVISRDNANIAGSENKTLDSLTPVAWDVAKWQGSIGSMYFPSHEVDSKSASYAISTQGLPFENEITYDEWENKKALVRVQLERSQILTGSGIAISANRGATIMQEFSGSVATRTLNLYVKHTRLVSVFIDNVAVRT